MSGYGVVERAISSLGKGFDITCDFRLKYCKGEDRLVKLNDAETRELSVPGFGSFKDVSVDIKGGKGDRTRYQSDILDFNHMSEFFNQKCAVPGKIPSGLFNSMYGFESGSWAVDAAHTKYLGLDGYFIALFHFRIDRYPLLISDEVRNSVPSAWDPSALARFIEKYGTHIIVGLSIGGHDVVLLRQDLSSNCEPSPLKNHLDNLGDQLFTGTCAFSPHQFRSKEQKHHHKAPQAFNVFDQQPDALNSFSAVSAKDGITVICSKRGGDTSLSSHCEWLPTVPTMPDAIHFSFIPITSLLKGVPGKGFLSHAINLYMRYKPPIADLQYFLDFQGHKLWAPIHNDLPLGPNTHRATRTPALQFNLMGPKLYVNTTQVTVGKRPITGMRLYLEGIKCNRLAIHLQHLSNPPILLQNKIVDDALTWRGSEQIADDRYFEPVHWKKFSHVCTAPVKYDPKWNPTNDNNISYLVTGAQLHVKEHDSKTVLHLRLLFAKTSSFCVVHSNWVHGLSENCHKSGFFSAISTSMMISGSGVEREKTKPAVVVDSSVYPTGPPVPVQTHKLLKFIDLSHKCRGPLDGPGHWLVTGAMLDVEKGKIGVHVKFSLLNMSS